MPLVLDGSQPSATAPIAQLPKPPTDTTPAPGALEVASAAERQANVAGMLYDRYLANPKPEAQAVPGFDPLASVPSGYEHFADRFLDSQSPQETMWIKSRIDSELADRQTIARAGGWGTTAVLAAGSTDPLTIASMAIPVSAPTRLVQAGKLAAIAGLTTAAQEGVAQELSPVRTAEESLTNVAASTILGGVIGAVIRPRIPAGEFDALRADFEARTPTVNPTGVSTAGAAAAAAPTLAENTISGAGNAIAKSPIGRVAPGLRLLTSPSTEARQLVQELAETSEVLNKNLEGVATPLAIETKLRGYEGDWWEGWKARGDAFREYRERIAGTDETALSRREFGQEVAYAMRRGDQSAIPEVAAAAQKTRAIVFEPLKQRAEALGLLPEDVKTTGADSYLMRQYDVQKIRANMSNWIDTLAQGFEEQGVERAEARDIAYKATRNVLGSERGTMDWRVLDDIVPTSGRLKERTLQLPDQRLEPYLNSDIDHLTHSYLRSLAPEVEITQRFGGQNLADLRAKYAAERASSSALPAGEGAIPHTAEEAAALRAERTAQAREEYLGTATPAPQAGGLDEGRAARRMEMTQAANDARQLKPQFDAVKDEYARLIEAAPEAEKEGLYKRMENDLRDLAGIRDRLYGIYGQPKDPASYMVRAGRLLRPENALRLLGVATVSHFPDIANVILKYGLPDTLTALGKLGTSLQAIRVARAEARRMGVGLDMVMNSTAALLGDYGSHSRFMEQRVMSRLTRGFTIATGETPLITTIQSLASVLGSDELLRNAEAAAAGKLLPQRTMTRLASDGIDREMLSRIASEAAEHGQEVNGLRFGMSDKWTDQGAAQAFEGLIAKQAHGMTLSPSVGDTPLYMSKELGKTLLQFKSFAFAASRHVLMPIAQGVPAGDVRAMSGLLALVSAGYMSYVTKQWLAGQPIETDNPKRLAMEVLDKSNLLGWTGEVIYPALWQMGFRDFSRWSDRDPIETLGGPSAGTIASLYERRFGSKLAAPLRNAAGDDTEAPEAGFSRSDLHFIRRLMPGQNIWYMRRAVNGLEDSIGDLFDLPGKSNADRAAATAQAN